MSFASVDIPNDKYSSHQTSDEHIEEENIVVALQSDSKKNSLAHYIILCIVIVVVLVLGTLVLHMSFSNRKDVLGVGTVKVKEVVGLPKTQTLLKGAISYNPGSNSIVYSNGVGVFDVGSTLPSSTLIFRPGYTGTSASVFSDWEKLCTTLAELPTPKYIYFDNSLNADPAAPMVIPVGDWNMTGTTWLRHQSGFQSSPTFINVEVSDGATLNGLLGISGPLEVAYESDDQPAIDLNLDNSARYTGFTLSDSARLYITGTKPFLNVVTTQQFYVILRNNAYLDGTGVSFNIESGIMVMQLFSHSTVNTNTIGGTGTFQLAPQTPDNIVNIPLNYPQVTGTFVYSNSVIAKCPNTYSRGSSPTGTDDGSKGYKIGDQWINTVTNTIFFLTDTATGFAVWRGPY